MFLASIWFVSWFGSMKIPLTRVLHIKLLAKYINSNTYQIWLSNYIWKKIIFKGTNIYYLMFRLVEHMIYLNN